MTASRLRPIFMAAVLFLTASNAFGQGAGSQGAPNAVPPTVAPPSPAPITPSLPPTVKPSVPNKLVAVDNPLAVKLNLGDGRKQWHPSRKQVGASTNDGGQTFTVDINTVTAYLTKIKPYVDRKPVNASLALISSVANNQVIAKASSAPVPVKIFPSRPGAILDVDASAKLIQQTIQASPDAIHIVLVTKEIPVKQDESRFAGIDSRIAHFVTHFNPGEAGRTQTVRLAISLADDHIVKPGATFSLNQTVGERTAARGFGTGIVFVNGHLDTQLGGGMCQVATTLFNATLLANLKIVERHQHVRTVPYVKPGQDATVYWGQKDFKFENNSDSPIYISYRTTATHAICDLYGKAHPSVKVSIDDQYQELGERHYTARLKRYVTEGGKTTVNYTASSSYDWTPALDYTM